MGQFDDRKLGSVVFREFSPIETREGLLMHGNVVIHLKTSDGEHDGPDAQISVGVYPMTDESIRDVQLDLLTAAIDIAKRIAAETPTALLEAWKKTSREVLEDD